MHTFSVESSLMDSEYVTEGGMNIIRKVEEMVGDTNYLLKLQDKINIYPGAIFSSTYEYQNRYTHWDIGFVQPPISIRIHKDMVSIVALNEKGEFLLKFFKKKLLKNKTIIQVKSNSEKLIYTYIKKNISFTEEERTKQPSVFTILREIKNIFFSSLDCFLGMYGAFGYDLIFQFEPINKTLSRDNEPDTVLYIPDQIFVRQIAKNKLFKLSYDFVFEKDNTLKLSKILKNKFLSSSSYDSFYTPKTLKRGKYIKKVALAIDEFKEGNLFEVVPSEIFYTKMVQSPANLFKKLQKINPSPYGFLINLGHNRYLVGSSPEMYVRVRGNRIETAPISGTIKRGTSAVDDAKKINELLNSKKDESELTMCTDVDRNDKSRICIPGSVKIIGRKHLEYYSHVIHTVDHVEGILSEEYDSMDAFITHMWSVTVTGSPKRAAIQWLERNEDSQRHWYGGAIGYLAFNGDINTGLTLRTSFIRDGIAEVRAGATLLYESIPKDEENEIYMKAEALQEALADKKISSCNKYESVKNKENKNILLVDHEDSFVHTLANYLKLAGGNVKTMRSESARKELEIKGNIYDLVVLSPGPSKPSCFDMDQTIKICEEKNISIFGVCLGMQGIIEYYGGELSTLNFPMHGKESFIQQTSDSYLWDNIPQKITVGRYHSLYGSKIPSDFKIISKSLDDNVPMAIEHKNKSIIAVQFHPESLMSSNDDIGFSLIKNIINNL